MLAALVFAVSTLGSISGEPEGAVVHVDGAINAADEPCSHSALSRQRARDLTSHEYLSFQGRHCKGTRAPFPSTRTLGYITPWNSKGYAFAEDHAFQLDMLSPVWLQLEDGSDDAKSSQGPSIELRGTHNVEENAGWLRRIKAKCAAHNHTASVDAPRCPQILPRVEWKSRYAPSPQKVKHAIKLVMGVLRKLDARGGRKQEAAGELSNANAHGRLLDGIVLEAPIVPVLLPLFEAFGRALHNPPLTKAEAKLKRQAESKGEPVDSIKPRPYTFVLVLPPSAIPEGTTAQQRSQPGLKPSEVARFVIPPGSADKGVSVVDFFSVMTYDYSAHRPGGDKGGPNAPLQWQVETIKALLGDEKDEVRRQRIASSLLLGVPFYGYDNAEAIVGHAFVNTLKQPTTSALRWDEQAQEYYVQYRALKGEPHTVYFPSPAMLRARTQAAQQLGCGIAIWELGQGLPFFADAI